ncbi:MAG: AAA family ATPase [Gammaproteobacteria bacterium]|nr:AAA family ATPase [Gammaproteobacteria bacterium]
MAVRKVVAVFGLSGVGKSTTVAKVVAAAEGLVASVNAGDLIGRGRPDGRGAEGLRLLGAEEILRNQELLVEELAVERMAPGPPVLLLDGHCVIDNGEELVPVPVGVVERLGVAAVVYLRGDAGVIRERRRWDGRRRRPDLDEARLSSQQESGLMACTSYAVELGLPMIVVTAAEYGLIVTLVEYLAREGMDTTEGGCG